MSYIKKLVVHGFKSFPRKTEIPFTQGINVVLGPNGSGKSARGDTEVLLASGETKPIGEIVEESLKNSSIKKNLDDGVLTFENPFGIEVFGLNPVTMKIEKCNVNAFIKRDGEPNLYTIKTKTGKEVTTTSCHPVLTYKNGKIVSEIVENLKKGELLASPRKLNLYEKKLFLKIPALKKNGFYEKETARFLGYLVGDGCIIKDRRVDFVNVDKEVLEDYSKILSKMGLKQSLSIRKNTKAKCIYVNSKSLSSQLISLFKNNYKKDKKHIPKEILFSKREILSSFLAALFDCDASVRRDNPTFEYVTMSERLANEVVTGLLRFGIVARKKKKVKYASNTLKKKKKEYYFVLVEGKDKISTLNKNIHLKCKHKKKLLEKWSSRKIISNTNNDILPKELNIEIRKAVKLLGIRIKSVRKLHPLLAAYVENRCTPSRRGLRRILNILNEKFALLISKYEKIMSSSQEDLVVFMDLMGVSSRKMAKSMDLHKTIIRNQWAKSLFRARENNLDKFRVHLKEAYLNRTYEIERIINILTNLSQSDIFWDKIESIERVKGEKFVYDLEISGNHNFVANNIFVHNSNVSDAICFVLGRLSIKSMRAAKAKNLIFMGTKSASPAKQASVEIVLDNSKKSFSLPDKEISIKRIVKKNGQSTYKINNQTKTRQEVLSLLAQAGIDPKGFNIILQGEIQNFVRMHPEERRKIIEEVSGISIYEMRKQKSLRELEKTEDKLKEVNSVLRERTSYLNNLEKERKQALRYKKLQKDVKRLKASIINSELKVKQKRLEFVNKEISKKQKQINKTKKHIVSLNAEIENLKSRIKEINSKVQKETGLEQEKLNQEIANLRADLAGLKVKIENSDSKLEDYFSEKRDLKESISESETELKSLDKPQTSEKKLKELSDKKQKLEYFEEERKKYYMLKSELNSLKEILSDKTEILQSYTSESDYLIKQIESLSIEIFDKNSSKEKLEKLRISLAEKRDLLKRVLSRETNLEKTTYAHEAEVESQNKILQKISKMDICPVCKNKITPEHMKEIKSEVLPLIKSLKEKVDKSDKELKQIYSRKEIIEKDIEQITYEIEKTESDLEKLSQAEEKKFQIKSLQQKSDKVRQELSSLKKRKFALKSKLEELSNIEKKCDTLKIEVEEISSRTRENVSSEISFKKREIERMKISLKEISRNESDLKKEAEKIKKLFSEKQLVLNEKKKKEEALNEKFKNLISERDSFQSNIRDKEIEISQAQNILNSKEQEINNLKIEKARFDAEVDNLNTELLEFKGIEFIKSGKEKLSQRLAKTQHILSNIGSVNMRSLEVYDSIKKEYGSIKEKAELISKEKENILKVIHEIDLKKKKVFIQTLKKLNEYFSRNFSQLSTKGEVLLELENKKQPFEAGVNIIVKTGHGKYFDVKSLSGGEQTLVALSLIFAIQEYKPYYFYLLDEIDAALDKRNSQRLARLLSKYMQKGQYIIISHNDEIISNATNLYGVSMHDGISKVISLEV